MFLKTIALLFIASVAASPVSLGLYQTTDVGLRRVDVPGDIVFVPDRTAGVIGSYDDSELRTQHAEDSNSLYPVSTCTSSVFDDIPQPYAVLIYAENIPDRYRKQLLTVKSADDKQKLLAFIKGLKGAGQFHDWYYVATAKEVDEAIGKTRSLGGLVYDTPLRK